MNEAELAERCGKGDNLARKQLYERYAGQLMAICIRYIGDRETAQDVLHDGFLNIFRSFDKFTYKGEGSLKAWLARVMVNEALGYLRKQSSANQEIGVGSILVICQELFEEDFDMFFRKKGNFNRPSVYFTYNRMSVRLNIIFGVQLFAGVQLVFDQQSKNESY